MSTKNEETKVLKNHEDTKAAKDNPEQLKKAKADPITKEPVKLSRADKLKAMEVSITEIAKEDFKGSDTAMNSYCNLFQLEEKSELIKMVQHLELTTGSMVLKTGFVLPVLPKTSEITAVVDILSVITSNETPFVIGLVNLLQDEHEDNITGFVYGLMEYLSLGRKANNVEWDAVEAEPYEGKPGYIDIYNAVQATLDEDYSTLKSIMVSLAPEAWEALNPLFARESFKKQGIVYSTPTDGRDVYFTGVTAQIVTVVMFDLLSPYIESVEVEDDSEPESSTQESTQSQKDETGSKDEEVYTEDGDDIPEDDYIEDEEE